MRFLINTISFYASCLRHNFLVLTYMLSICAKLCHKALTHDLSKYQWKEAKHFIPHFHKLQKTKYGEKDYDDSLVEVKKALKHHYAKNMHHPEYFADGIRGMSLCDVIEMWCDWKAAVKKHKTGNIYKSLDHNTERFMLDGLIAIFVNTTLLEHKYLCKECGAILAPTKTGFACVECHTSYTHLCMRVRHEGIFGSPRKMKVQMEDAHAWLENALSNFLNRKHVDACNCVKHAMTELERK